MMNKALHPLAVAVALSAALVAHADGNPVGVQYTGSLASVDSQLAGGLPVGTAIGVNLTFNETFSDGTYDFADALGPVSGTLTLGALSYSLNDYLPHATSFNGGALTDVSIQFLGSGPLVTGFDLYGLFIKFSTGLAIDSVEVAYEYDSGPSTAFFYAEAEGRGTVTSLAAPNEVPLPNTLALVTLGLFAVMGTMRRGGRAGFAQNPLHPETRLRPRHVDQASPPAPEPAAIVRLHACSASG